jgi:hypothetical protein
MFCVVPLQSLSVMMPSVDPDPVASFQHLIAPPPETAREAPRIDPRKVRTIGKAADQECSFSKSLRKHIETTAPAPEEDESKRRGL